MFPLLSMYFKKFVLFYFKVICDFLFEGQISYHSNKVLELEFVRLTSRKARRVHKWYRWVRWRRFVVFQGFLHRKARYI